MPNKSGYLLYAILLSSCTSKEQEEQILRIIHNRKQKEKLCAQSVTKDT